MIHSLRIHLALDWILSQPDCLIEVDSHCRLQHVHVGSRSFSAPCIQDAIEAAYEELYLEPARDAIRREEA